MVSWGSTGGVARHICRGLEASRAEKERASDTIGKKLEFISTQMKGPYIFGDHPTVADAYLFVMLMWATKIGIPIPEILQAFGDRLSSRPTVQVALKHEGLS
jgi:glutathione S-transferase